MGNTRGRSTACEGGWGAPHPIPDSRWGHMGSVSGVTHIDLKINTVHCPWSGQRSQGDQPHDRRQGVLKARGGGGLCNANINERLRGRSLLPGHGTCSTSKVGGWWRLAVGGWWQLVLVTGG